MNLNLGTGPPTKILLILNFFTNRLTLMQRQFLFIINLFTNGLTLMQRQLILGIPKADSTKTLLILNLFINGNL